MSDSNVTKADQAPSGPQGQKYLAGGEALSMRLWDRAPPSEPAPPVRRAYETVGYALAGRAELTIGGKAMSLQPGTSWVVPKDAEHSYRILEAFTAIEATHPPARENERDAAPD